MRIFSRVAASCTLKPFAIMQADRVVEHVYHAPLREAFKPLVFGFGSLMPRHQPHAIGYCFLSTLSSFC